MSDNVTIAYWKIITFERGMQLVAKFAERVVARLVVRNDMDAVPGPTRVLEEVVARVDGLVHR